MNRLLSAAFVIGLVGVLLLGSRAGTAPIPETKPDPSALTVAIALPVVHDQRAVEFRKDPQPLYVVVTNTTKQPIKLWREWCSWGYYNLSFEATDEQGKTHKLVKQEIGWHKNYPDALLLPSEEPYVLEVKFDPEVWDIPVPKRKDGQPLLLKLRAVYEITADRETRQDGVWTGKVASTALNVIIKDNR